MSFAVVYSRGLAGLDAPLVRVEVHLGTGLPAFNMVGLPDTEVKEARDRVRAALNCADFRFPQRRVTVSLAPADLPKESGRFDLPIAIGILAADGELPTRELGKLEFAGELALSGELRAIRGALAMTFGAQREGRAFVLPEASAREAALARHATILPARTLLEVFHHLRGDAPISPYVAPERAVDIDVPDLADVRGQPMARRALEIAAAGGHSLLFSGPPGTGKTMLATRIPGILPPMSEEEALEAAAVQSLGSSAFDPERFGLRAFRAPHHTASGIALVGGGSPPRPGEVSLAHHGILFLDELPEFSRHVLEVLREPLESGRITISRAARQADYPAGFQLVAAMNPCPCGFLGHHSGRCKCRPGVIARYRARVSGPLIDRIDLHLEMQAIAANDLASETPGEESRIVRERVAAARERQVRRQRVPNARLRHGDMESRARITQAARAFVREAGAARMLSARGHDRVLKVARTIADLAGHEDVTKDDAAEALLYRPEAQPG